VSGALARLVARLKRANERKLVKFVRNTVQWGLTGKRKHELERLRRTVKSSRTYPVGQWSRWYQQNRRYQKRHGVNLLREWVR
jgi:hypothetical protein